MMICHLPLISKVFAITASVCFLLLTTCLVKTSADGIVEIKLISYINNGNGRNKRHCDEFIGGKTSKCDLQFTIKMNGQNAGVGPKWDTVRSMVFHEKDSVYFGALIGGFYTNPFQLNFRKWQGIFNIEVHVIDKDSFSSDDHVDSFGSAILVTADGKPRQHNIKSKYDSILAFSLKVSCNEFFLSPTCVERCKENIGQQVCGTTNIAENQCSSPLCRRGEKAAVIVTCVMIFLLLIGLIVMFRRRKHMRSYIPTIVKSRQENGASQFRNVVYELSPRISDNEATQEFANNLYNLDMTTHASLRKHSHDSAEGSVYDSLESNIYESDGSEKEDADSARDEFSNETATLQHRYENCAAPNEVELLDNVQL